MIMFALTMIPSPIVCFIESFMLSNLTAFLIRFRTVGDPLSGA